MSQGSYFELMRNERWLLNIAGLILFSSVAYQMYLDMRYQPRIDLFIETGDPYGNAGSDITFEFVIVFVVGIILQSLVAGMADKSWLTKVAGSQKRGFEVAKRLMRVLSLIIFLVACYSWKGVIVERGWLTDAAMTNILIGGIIAAIAWFVLSVFALRLLKSGGKGRNSSVSGPSREDFQYGSGNSRGNTQSGNAWDSDNKDLRGPFL